MDQNLRRKRPNCSENKEEFYAKKARFRRRLIEKYSTRRYNLNTKITSESSLKRIYKAKVKLKREFLSKRVKSNQEFLGSSKPEGGDRVAENLNNSSSNISAQFNENPKECPNLNSQVAISQDDHSENSSVGQSEKWKIVSLDFYSYLTDRVAESRKKSTDEANNSNVKRRRRKRGINKKSAKKEENREGTYVSHDPYFDSWVDLGEAKVEEKIGLLARLGVNQPLFPLVHRNIVTMCGRKDSEITNTWAEFALSTLITEDCDSDPKQVLLPVVDPLLLRAVEDFNQKWGTQFNEVEIVNRPRRNNMQVHRSRIKEIKSDNIERKIIALKSEPRSDTDIQEKPKTLATPPSRQSPRERKKRLQHDEIYSSKNSESANIDCKMPASTDAEEKPNVNVAIPPSRSKSSRERKKRPPRNEISSSLDSESANIVCKMPVRKTEQRSRKKDSGTNSWKCDFEPMKEVPDWDTVALKCGFKPCWVLVKPLQWHYVDDCEYQLSGGDIKSKWFDQLVEGKIPDKLSAAHSQRVISTDPQPPVIDVDEEQCPGDHIFGYDHSMRTYGVVLDYRFRNNSFVYAYKMRRILKFQHKNNKYFKSSSYCRRRILESVDEDIFIDVLTEENSPDSDTDRQVQPNVFSSNPLEMFTFPRRNLFGLTVIKNASPLTEVPQKIQFVDGALLKRKIPCKWLVVEFTRDIEFVIFKEVSILPAQLIFEVMYRADLTKKLVCTKISDESCDELLQFGMYGIPGICNAVLLGPYSLDEPSPMLQAPAQLAADGKIKYVDVLPKCDPNVEKCDSVQAFWWHPMTPTAGIMNNAAYLNFLFTPPNSTAPPSCKEKLFIRDLLLIHQARTYLTFQTKGKFQNHVLIHDLMEANNVLRKVKDESHRQGNDEVSVETDIVTRKVTDESRQPRKARRSMETDMMPPKVEGGSPLKSVKRNIRFVPTVSSVNNENNVAENGSYSEKSSIARLRDIRARIDAVKERQRRQEFAYYKENLLSTIRDKEDVMGLVTILEKSKNMIKSMKILDQKLNDQKIELKWIRNNLLKKCLVLAERGNHTKAQLFSIRKKFLESLSYPNRAERIETEYKSRENISNDVDFAPLKIKDEQPLPPMLQKNSVRRVSSLPSPPASQLNNAMSRCTDIAPKPSTTRSSTASRFRTRKSRFVNNAPKPDLGELPLPSIKSVRSAAQMKGPYNVRRKRDASITGTIVDMPSSTRLKVPGLANNGLKFEDGSSAVAFVDHSYSRVENELQDNQLPVNPSKAHRYDASHDKKSSDRMLIYLLENEQPISKLQISRIKKPHNDQTDLQEGGSGGGVGGASEIKTSNLIQLLLETLKAKQQKGDIEKPEEKTKLTYHLKILEKMLSGSKKDSSLDKTDILEISANEENINLYTGNKKYSCRIIRSPPVFDYAETGPDNAIKKVNDAIHISKKNKVANIRSAVCVEEPKETVVESAFVDNTESNTSDRTNLLGDPNKLSFETIPHLRNSVATRRWFRPSRPTPILLRRSGPCQSKLTLKVPLQTNKKPLSFQRDQTATHPLTISPSYQSVENAPVAGKSLFSFCWKKCTDEKDNPPVIETHNKVDVKNDLGVVAGASPSSVVSLKHLIQEETKSDSGNESDPVLNRLLSVKSFANVENLNTRLYSNLVKLLNTD